MSESAMGGAGRSAEEVRRALGLSHRAASLALAQCEEWGLIRRAANARRSGQRGPAAAAWEVVGDHWTWFRRVAQARLERETGPVVPVLERCVAEARAAGDAGADLERRLAELLVFVRTFDRGVEIVVQGQPRSIERLFGVLDRLNERTVARLWNLADELEPTELVSALDTLAKLPPGAVHRLIAIADSGPMRKLLGLR
ncbi:MAG TPA: hypothetical protein VFH98_07660 [Candidatus Limnocylindria bacterium]|nr:hypothetical protein [Candidatus Limnocylindria bacterium]